MQTQRMLELAARAAGYSPCRVTDDGIVLMRGVRVRWKPLEDDGDALRLACAVPSLDLRWVIAASWKMYDTPAERCTYVRRKIVEFAAEMESLKEGDGHA